MTAVSFTGPWIMGGPIAIRLAKAARCSFSPGNCPDGGPGTPDERMSLS